MEPETRAQGGDGATGDAKYRIVLKLSEGGTANVFLGVARGPGGFNKLVVLKVPKEHIFLEADSRRMFMNEARLAARLNHANIVQTNEVIDEGGRPVLVMEYLEGQALSSILARGRSSIPLAMHLAILSEALSGLHYVHEYADFDGGRLNIVHRDMTPHNVFVTFDGQVKLLDFGIAKLDRADGGTETGVVKGKLRYMSPQQIMGEKLDRRADLFAVGVMLWEAAARERMWRDEADPVIMQHLVNGEVPLPSTVKPDVAPELERIAMKALAAEPDDRYATAADLQRDLDTVRATLGQHSTMSRDVGKFVADLFADVRQQTKTTVSASLSKVASLSVDEYKRAESELAGGTTLLSTYTGSSNSVGAVPPPEKRGRLGLVLAAIAVAGVLAFSLRRAFTLEAPPGVAAAPVPATVIAPTPTTPSAAPPATADSVDMTLTAVPADARLYLDDSALQSNPFHAKMPRDGVMHRVRAEAAGYVAQSTGILLDRDAAIVLTLERGHARDQAGGVHGGAGTGARPAATPTVAAAPRPDCNPPFTIDERGIKKFKPECL